MRKFFYGTIFLICAAILFTGCGTETKITSLKELEKGRLAVWSVSAITTMVQEKFPDAKFFYIDSVGDMVQTLNQNKIDAFFIEKTRANSMQAEGIKIDYLPESVGKLRIGYIFTKNEKGRYLCTQMNEFLKKLTDSGELDKLKEKWFNNYSTKKTYKKSELSGENGTLKMLSEASAFPYSYIQDGEVTGYELELIDKFCAEYGYNYEIEITDFGVMIGNVSLGRADVGIAAMQYTEERGEQFLFSEPTQWDDCIAVIKKSADNSKKTLSDFKNSRIGCWPECGYEVLARKILPDAQYIYIDTLGDLVLNLKQNKIDSFVLGKVYADNLISSGVEVEYLDESFGEISTAFMFTKSAKGEKLQSQMNEFLKKLTDGGELDNLKDKWFTGGEEKRVFEKNKLSGESGTLIIETDAISGPYVYLKENEVTGYEIELIDKFCAEYGYNYEIKITEFETMLGDINLGKGDIGVDAIEYKPERGENMLFSNPNNVDQCILIVNSNSADDESFLSTIENRLVATLITENRWQMILDGIKITLIITIFAIIFGTLAGFAIFMVYREKNPTLNKIIDKMIRILQGLPQMILLMFFYYVIFGSVEINSAIVAVIVFSILLSVAVFIMLKSGTESIPKGQMEAALALGFSERKAFLKFILPQVTVIFFPTYQKTIVELLLSTSIVGYIAVQDLTKMGDLIRARTFDAFVPLIVVSAIYFALSWLLLKLTDKILTKIDPKNRKREEILKDVDL